MSPLVPTAVQPAAIKNTMHAKLLHAASNSPRVTASNSSSGWAGELIVPWSLVLHPDMEETAAELPLHEYEREASAMAISSSSSSSSSPSSSAAAAAAGRETAPADGTDGTCSISLTKQLSSADCAKDRSFGCSSATNNTMWVKDGCRGVFTCGGVKSVVCNPCNPHPCPAPKNTTYSCKCVAGRLPAPPPPPPPLPRVWRANLYRTDKAAGQASQELSAWSPIGEKGVPAAVSFHVPHKFGVFILDN